MSVPHARAAGDPDLAAVARLLADDTRACFCWALLDGRARTASELARHAGVAASTATDHLHTLVRGNLLVQERQGRHRYVRIDDPRVAELIEHLAALAPRRAPRARTLSAVNRRHALAHARTCYDHLAGTVGVAITDAMTRRGLLSFDDRPGLTDDGADWLAGLGISPLPTSRRPAVRPCLDWTERRPHLAGAVGAALCRHALDAGWVVRIGTARAVAVTDAGRAALREHLGLSEEVLRRESGQART